MGAKTFGLRISIIDFTLSRINTGRYFSDVLDPKMYYELLIFYHRVENETSFHVASIADKITLYILILMLD